MTFHWAYRGMVRKLLSTCPLQLVLRLLNTGGAIRPATHLRVTGDFIDVVAFLLSQGLLFAVLHVFCFDLSLQLVLLSSRLKDFVVTPPLRLALWFPGRSELYMSAPLHFGLQDHGGKKFLGGRRAMLPTLRLLMTL